MAKVTSKLQVTVPVAMARRYRIRPGDDVLWVAAGDSLRLEPAPKAPVPEDIPARLRLFDAATRRQEQRQSQDRPPAPASGRGWTREELYDRDRSR